MILLTLQIILAVVLAIGLGHLAGEMCIVLLGVVRHCTRKRRTWERQQRRPLSFRELDAH